MYRNLLVPLDGSAFAEHALPLALALARRSAASLSVASVAPSLTTVYAEGVTAGAAELESHLLDARRAYLDRVVQRLFPVLPEAVSSTLLTGEVADSLCSFVTSSGVDLVVMATHGRGPMGRFWLGSVADEMLRRLTVPLLLVRPRDEPSDLQREPEISRILVPLDGSPLAEGVLEPAFAIGGLYPAEFTLLRVVSPVVGLVQAAGHPSSIGDATLLEQVTELHEQEQREAEAYLEKTASGLRERGLRLRTRVVVDEPPAAAILKEAQAMGANLIALATHGRRGLARLFLGSVSDKVVRAATVPVLVQRPQRKR
jgi:nucleotide-binding universal stress UspA family protein